MKRIDDIEREQMRTDVPYLQAGDKVRVHVKIKEGGKERIQVFEGTVIRVARGNNRSTITVRKISYGVGVERIFPVHSPGIDRIDVVSHGKVHQGRLYYLRNLRGKAARIKER
jgi:large subunit ribosomal protein L19